MNKIAWMMEWCGDLATPDLVEMQREIRYPRSLRDNMDQGADFIAYLGLSIPEVKDIALQRIGPY